MSLLDIREMRKIEGDPHAQIDDDDGKWNELSKTHTKAGGVSSFWPYILVSNDDGE